MTYSLKKLKRSLGKRVEQYLIELLPDAEVARDGDDRITIKQDDLDGSISIAGMCETCHREDRSMWGPIAGSFCNLVASRVRAHSVPTLNASSELSKVYPVVQSESEEDDRLIREATPMPDLQVASAEWLPGLRVEFEYHGDQTHRRLFVRDINRLGMDSAVLTERAVTNMKALVPSIQMGPVGAASMAGRVLAIFGEGVAPAMLRAAAGHEAMFAGAERASGERPKRLLACAPRSDQVTFCNIKDRSAASMMVSRAWDLFEQELDTGVPLSPRLFVIAAPGDVRYLDVGIGADRVAEWAEHELGGCSLRVPDDWNVREADERWVIWPGQGGPRIRARVVTSGGTPGAASALAERVSDRHKSEGDVGYGFFNGLAWAWVDTGHHDGHSTASMFVALPGGMLILQTEVPDATDQGQAVALQKIIATVQPTAMPAPEPEP